MARPLIVRNDDAEGNEAAAEVVFLPHQWNYDARNLLHYSPDPTIDLAVLTAATVNRKYSGIGAGWADFPIDYMRRRFKISFSRLRDSVDRLLELGILESKGINIKGSTPKLRYRSRGRTVAEFTIEAFEKLSTMRQDSEVEQAIEEVNVPEPPTPKPIEISEPKVVEDPNRVSTTSTVKKEMVDTSHYAQERGGLTLKGYIYVESVDNSNKPVWKNLPIQEFTKDMSKYAVCVRCGRACAKELLNSDSICEICKTEL